VSKANEMHLKEGQSYELMLHMSAKLLKGIKWGSLEEETKFCSQRPRTDLNMYVESSALDNTTEMASIKML
jgi:hypothetical protein